MSNKDGFDLKDVKDLTVGEAAQKDSDLKAGITNEDSVLDKYIKRHREEVASQKYAGETSELDTSSLEQFIKKQRDGLSETATTTKEAITSEIEEVLGAPASETSTVVEEATSGLSRVAAKASEEEKAAAAAAGAAVVGASALVASKTAEAGETAKEAVTTVASKATETASQVAGGAGVANAAEETIGLIPEEDEPIYKNKKWIIASILALILGIFGAGYYLNNANSSSTTVASQSSSSSSSSDSSTKTSSSTDKEAEENKKAFDELYATFFTDEDQKSLKNDSFDNLSKLKTLLNKLKDTEYYDEAKSKYDSLSKSIDAVNAVNALYESDALVDGQLDTSVALASGADVDSISAATLNTGNADLDSLLQQAVSAARNQETEASSAETAEVASANEAIGAEVVASAPVGAIDAGSTTTDTASADSTSDAASSTASGSTSATGSTAATAIAADGSSLTGTSSLSVVAATTYGIQSYDVSTLQRDLSRLAYDESAIADTSNEAWVFGEGILEKIIETSHQRGYFSGNDYILERVAIVNGNGYYNMFKADGTYLFTINAKTGYFVGNGSGYVDDLDF